MVLSVQLLVAFAAVLVSSSPVRVILQPQLERIGLLPYEHPLAGVIDEVMKNAIEEQQISGFAPYYSGHHESSWNQPRGILQWPLEEYSNGAYLPQYEHQLSQFGGYSDEPYHLQRVEHHADPREHSRAAHPDPTIHHHHDAYVPHPDKRVSYYGPSYHADGHEHQRVSHPNANEHHHHEAGQDHPPHNRAAHHENAVHGIVGLNHGSHPNLAGDGGLRFYQAHHPQGSHPVQMQPPHNH